MRHKTVLMQNKGAATRYGKSISNKQVNIFLSPVHNPLTLPTINNTSCDKTILALAHKKGQLLTGYVNT